MNTEDKEKEVDSSKTVEKNEAEISVEDAKEVKLEENPKGEHSSKDSVEENIESTTARDSDYSEESEDDSSKEKSITNKKIYKELKSLKKEIKRLRKSVKKLKKSKKKKKK